MKLFPGVNCQLILMNGDVINDEQHLIWELSAITSTPHLGCD